jgi:Fe-S-cluster-containing hydrogenase component 2
VTREQAREYVQRCREAGLVHMIGRIKMDALWLDAGPGDRLLSICNCCPCCCIWRMLPNLAPQISSRVHKMPGVEVTVTGDCQACGVCTQGICFVDAIHLDGDSAVITEACRGCGLCVDACPHGAIQLTINGEHAVQCAIDRITHLVDVT